MRKTDLPTRQSSLVDVRSRLQAWLDDIQLSARLGMPHYANPSQLKADLRLLLNGAERAEKHIQAIIDLAESGNIPGLTSGVNHNASHGKAALRALRGESE